VLQAGAKSGITSCAHDHDNRLTQQTYPDGTAVLDGIAQRVGAGEQLSGMLGL